MLPVLNGCAPCGPASVSMSGLGVVPASQTRLVPGNAVMPSSTQFIPELGKALSGNAVMPSSTQFIPELGKALSGYAVMPSSTQFISELFIPELGRVLSDKL